MPTTIKRTTVKHTPVAKSAARPIPPLPDQGRPPLQGRGPEIEQPIYTEGEPDEGLEDQLPPDENGEEADQTIETVGEEQLRRSQEMETMGIDAWVKAHDERNPEDMSRQVEGVTPLER